MQGLRAAREGTNAGRVKGRSPPRVGEHDIRVIEFELPRALTPRARRALWLAAWAALAIGGAVAALLGGLFALDATVDAALSGQADATAAPIVTMALGLLALVAGAGALVYLVARGGDPVDASEASASEEPVTSPPTGGLSLRQPLQASWVWRGDDAD